MRSGGWPRRSRRWRRARSGGSCMTRSPDVRADAAGALGDVLAHGGKEAIAALKAAGHDPDAATRRRAAGALGRAGKGPLAAQAARALASFAGDVDPSVRAEAAAAMGALGPAGKEAGGALAQLVGDKDPTVRAAARTRGARDRAGRGRPRQGAVGVVRRRQPG